MKTTTTSKFGSIFTTYTAKNPYKVELNERNERVSFFKQIIVLVNGRNGRVLYDRNVVILIG